MYMGLAEYKTKGETGGGGGRKGNSLNGTCVEVQHKYRRRLLASLSICSSWCGGHIWSTSEALMGLVGGEG